MRSKDTGVVMKRRMAMLYSEFDTKIAMMHMVKKSAQRYFQFISRDPMPIIGSRRQPVGIISIMGATMLITERESSSGKQSNRQNENDNLWLLEKSWAVQDDSGHIDILNDISWVETKV